MFILLYPFPTHPFYIEMFASKASLLKSLLCLLSLTSIWALSIQQKVMQEGIVVPGTNIDKCYCSSINPYDLHTHGRVNYTVKTSRHRYKNVFILGKVWHKHNIFILINSKFIFIINTMTLYVIVLNCVFIVTNGPKVKLWLCVQRLLLISLATMLWLIIYGLKIFCYRTVKSFAMSTYYKFQRAFPHHTHVLFLLPSHFP